MRKRKIKEGDEGEKRGEKKEEGEKEEEVVGSSHEQDTQHCSLAQ